MNVEFSATGLLVRWRILRFFHASDLAAAAAALLPPLHPGNPGAENCEELREAENEDTANGRRTKANAAR